jgi:hypothetical protein
VDGSSDMLLLLLCRLLWSMLAIFPKQRGGFVDNVC